MEKSSYKYLNNVDSPADLKRLGKDELATYCAEMRDFIVHELAKNPGHLSSSLGTVELATALHYVFNTPDDKLVWDVGHQAYAHKIITGRRDRFHTNRKLGGLSGFPRMSESKYDAFGCGHASISISAAYGLAEASKLQHKDNHIIAVIGDGALTGGLAFEGLNNAGASDADILVILNDNNMAIAPSVGAMKEYLLSISTSKHYNDFKSTTWRALSIFPRLRGMMQKFFSSMKSGLLQQSNLFESLNFRYFGPVDGNDINAMVKVLNDLKEIKGPKLLHVMTVKGKGYASAELGDPSVWHAPGCFDPESGELIENASSDLAPKYQDVFGATLLDFARSDSRIVGVTPAMSVGCSMDMLFNAMPDRCFDVGIAEAHAVTFSAGLAADGMIPFCNIYSSFMQRAYDNIIHDVALQNLHVILCLDRAGLVGEDGATHHGTFDLSYLRPIPNLVVCAPRNEQELRDMMQTAVEHDGPFAIRYPRGRGEGTERKEIKSIEIGKSETLREGNDVALLTIGTTAADAAKAANAAAEQGVSVHHVDLRWAKPLDGKMLMEVGRRFGRVITVEDGSISGGVGSAVLEFFADNDLHPSVQRLGIADNFVDHGKVGELKHACGYDSEGILEALLQKN